MGCGNVCPREDGLERCTAAVANMLHPVHTQAHPSDCHHAWHAQQGRIKHLLCASRATAPGMDCYFC
jgi:hypothetical protein